MANESAPGLGLGAADTPGAVAPPSQEAVSDKSGILNWIRGGLAEPGQPGWASDLSASVEKQAQESQAPQAPPGQLSDGSMNHSFPVNGTPQEKQWSMDKAEAALEQKIRAEMARTKAPSITTQGKIYTADGGVYPNTEFGKAQAAVGGKGAEIMAGAARAGTGAVAPGLDLASSVLNAARHKLGNVSAGGFFSPRPELADPKNDIPLVSTSLQQKLGIPGIDPNAPTWQRVLESAGSGVGAGLLKSATTGVTRAVAPAVTQGVEAAGSSVTGTAAADAARSIYQNLIGAAAGEGGSQLGAHLLKPFGLEEFGSILGGVAAPFAGGVPYSKITRNLVGGLSAKRADVPSVAPDINRSRDEQRYMERQNEATGTNPPIGDARDISAAMDRQNLPSSFTALANPVWQRVAKVVASALPLGSHTRSANDALEAAIESRLHQTGEAVAGVPLPREGVSPGHIGTVLTRGAEQAIPHIDNLVRGIYEPINRTMRAAGDIVTTPVVSAIRRMIAGGTLTPAAEQAAGSQADALAARSPGGVHPDGTPGYDESARGPAPTLPSPEVLSPWDLAKSVRGTLRNMIGDKTIVDPVKRTLGQIKGTLTDVMNRATERAGLQPGEWDRARTETGDLERQKRAMEDIAGHQIGRDTGVFDEAGSKEMTAYNRIHENRQSPSALDPFMHHAFPDAARREAMGGYIASLGRRKGGFRSQYLAEDLHPSTKEGMDPAFRDRLTAGGPQEQATTATQTLQDLGTVGGNTTTPTSRFGLTDTLGASGALVGALKGAGDIVRGAGHIGGMLASPLTYSTLYPISRWLESERMRQAQLGNREPVGNDVFSGLARAGAQAGQDPLDRKGTYWKNLVDTLTGGSKVPMPLQYPSVQTPAKREPLIVPVAPTRK